MKNIKNMTVIEASQLSLAECIHYLESEFKYSSTSTALCIIKVLKALEEARAGEKNIGTQINLQRASCDSFSPDSNFPNAKCSNCRGTEIEHKVNPWNIIEERYMPTRAEWDSVLRSITQLEHESAANAILGPSEIRKCTAYMQDHRSSGMQCINCGKGKYMH